MNPMMSAAKKRRRTTIDPVTPRHRSLAEGAAAAVAAASGEAGPADISAVGYRDAPPPEVLFNKSWRLFSSSPMFKFDSDAKTLKSYAKQFSAFLLAKRNHGGGVAVSGVSGAKLAKFSVLPGVSWTDDDPDAILVEIDGAKPADSLQSVLHCHPHRRFCARSTTVNSDAQRRALSTFRLCWSKHPAALHRPS
eukprot:m.157244 g.157244  ORF g.157244 m.157244 type:complete len:193 (+) comp23653_c0_seq7:3-581(+)